MKTMDLSDKKYTIVYDETGRFPVKVLRYGEDWRDVLGDNLIMFLCARVEEQQNHIIELEKQLEDAQTDAKAERAFKDNYKMQLSDSRRKGAAATQAVRNAMAAHYTWDLLEERLAEIINNNMQSLDSRSK